MTVSFDCLVLLFYRISSLSMMQRSSGHLYKKQLDYWWYHVLFPPARLYCPMFVKMYFYNHNVNVESKNIY